MLGKGIAEKNSSNIRYCSHLDFFFNDIHRDDYVYCLLLMQHHHTFRKYFKLKKKSFKKMIVISFTYWENFRGKDKLRWNLLRTVVYYLFCMAF